MAEISLAELSPWTGLWRRGRFGTTGQQPGVVISEPTRAGMLLLAARKGQGTELLKAAKGWRVELPTSPRWVEGRNLTFLWAGPSQWLVRGPGSYAELAAGLTDLAPYGVFIDQSHSRATLTVGGARARDALAKGFEIDLHPRAFGPGDVALTQAVGMSAHLWQLDEAPTYTIAVPGSFAGSFWHWLSEAAAEYGYRVEDGKEDEGSMEPSPPGV